MDQSIEQLNDVTAVSGVNLRVRFLVASVFNFDLDVDYWSKSFFVCIWFRKRKNNYFLGARKMVVFPKHLGELCTKKKKD